jgi:hypothetical protein
VEVVGAGSELAGAEAVEVLPVAVEDVGVDVVAGLVAAGVVPDDTLDELLEEPQPASARATVRSAGIARRDGPIERGTVATPVAACAVTAGRAAPCLRKRCADAVAGVRDRCAPSGRARRDIHHIPCTRPDCRRYPNVSYGG